MFDFFSVDNSSGDQLDDKIDFVICLGGDGTLLHASSLFQVSIQIVCVGSRWYLMNFRLLLKMSVDYKIVCVFPT